jgi:hypothetical protein
LFAEIADWWTLLGWDGRSYGTLKYPSSKKSQQVAKRPSRAAGTLLSQLKNLNVDLTPVSFGPSEDRGLTSNGGDTLEWFFSDVSSTLLPSITSVMLSPGSSSQIHRFTDENRAFPSCSACRRGNIILRTHDLIR